MYIFYEIENNRNLIRRRTKPIQFVSPSTLLEKLFNEED